MKLLYKDAENKILFPWKLDGPANMRIVEKEWEFNQFGNDVNRVSRSGRLSDFNPQLSVN